MKQSTNMLTYLVGTKDEMLGVPQLEENRRRFDVAVQNQDWNKVVQTTQELVGGFSPSTDRQSMLEYYGTLAYMGVSIPLVAIIPAAGIPLAADSCTRGYRMLRKGACPVGLVGTVRELYHKLKR